MTARDRALARRLSHLLADRRFQQGFWGVYVYSLDRRRVLFQANGDRWFTPASNAKLFTLAAALHLLGCNFRFHTGLEATAPPGANGVVAGDLVLRGGGDPSLSGRPYPYRVDPPAPQLPFDPEAVPSKLARRVAAHGVHRIAGDVVGDDSAFAPDPYPRGWAIGDMLWDYGAPVSALTLNDNTRFLQITPGAAVGAAVETRFAPALLAPQLENHATTGPAGSATRLRLRPDPLTGALRLTGQLALDSRGDLEALAVPQPALFAAQLLRQALIEQGIAVDGVARARHLAAAAAPSYPLGGWDSPPLAEVLQATAKLSQNLEAEIMLRQLGKWRGAAPTSAAGEAVVRTFLKDAGLNANDDALVDGSGLARQDLVTPAGIVRLLGYMARQPEAAAWRALFPVAGRDGTLQHRFLGSPAAGRLRAKTGSLSHVNSLSGYVTTASGEHLAFALLSNNNDLPATAVRAQLDRLAAALAQ
ncbi:MAG TPA: D-alanyl-D-alanine carboxypeptidase/D-alanyl-D-alanine-endopeptidase [Terriglobales bacterium]|nr:D-alanyl-D-alanine carboxypeptidase/D-alanyl-D-alanine-endopeptidase [Terriglobales bacterium]